MMTLEATRVFRLVQIQSICRGQLNYAKFLKFFFESEKQIFFFFLFPKSFSSASFLFAKCFQKSFSFGKGVGLIVDKFWDSLALNVHSILHELFLDWSKLKAFADDNLNVVQMMIYGLDRKEDIVRKGKNAGTQHHVLFP